MGRSRLIRRSQVRFRAGRKSGRRQFSRHSRTSRANVAMPHRGGFAI